MSANLTSGRDRSAVLSRARAGSLAARRDLRIGSLFSGYGGLDLGVRSVLGGSVAWHVEVDPDASRVLSRHWPDVPNLGDITRVDWSTVDPVDVLTGGFPCQDVSSAGKRAGIRPGTRSGLWSQMAYAVSVLRPRLVIAENVRGLLSAPAASHVEPCPWCVGDTAEHAVRALGAVLGDLANLGYDAAWCGLRAADVGAPHARYRIFVAAADTAVTGRWRPRAVDSEVPARRGQRCWPQPRRHDRSVDLRGAAAHPEGDRRHQGRTEPARQLGRPDPALGGVPAPDTTGERHRHAGPPGRQRVQSAAIASNQRAVAADTNSDRCGVLGSDALRARRDLDRRGSVDWGEYTAAVRRWERRLGRAAPEPTTEGRRGARVLSPEFVEWMQGLSEGHVTGVPGLSRNAMLRMLGNGVVPQQAAAVLPWLLDVLNDPPAEVA